MGAPRVVRGRAATRVSCVLVLSVVPAPVTVRAPSKVNLHLAVGDLRPDGYHDLHTVFQALSLYDEVSVVGCGPAQRARLGGRRRRRCPPTRPTLRGVPQSCSPNGRA